MASVYTDAWRPCEGFRLSTYLSRQLRRVRARSTNFSTGWRPG
jgi:hypothetical protein